MAASRTEPRSFPRPSGRIRPSRIGPLEERLARLGLVSDWDFLLHLPIRYEDETRITPIAELQAGIPAQIQGTVRSADMIHTARGEQFSAWVQDESGSLTARFIYFYPSVKQQFLPGRVVRLYGEPRRAYAGGLEMIHPKVRAPVSDVRDLPHALTPVYGLGEGVQQHWMRKQIAKRLLDLNGVAELVPEAWLKKLNLPTLRAALEYLHQPPPEADAGVLAEHDGPYWARIKFDELLAQQTALREMRKLAAGASAPALLPNSSRSLTSRFLERLPFPLTGAQERVWRELAADLEKTRPMRRLVQGDVGSGKTVVAALAALRAVEAGRQAAIMAPTEILAEQHFENLKRWLEPLGVRMIRLSGSLKAAEKRAALEAIASGEAEVAVGTHALIQESVRFKDLGLAVIDEQHRFGVAQRLKLRRAESDGEAPHLLMMSATPIPRTLAMSYLADLDVSVIDEMPPGRTPVETKLVRIDRRSDVLAVVRDQDHELACEPDPVREEHPVDLPGRHGHGPHPPELGRPPPERPSLPGHRELGVLRGQPRQELVEPRRRVVVGERRGGAAGAAPPPLRARARPPVPLHRRPAGGAPDRLHPRTSIPSGLTVGFSAIDLRRRGAGGHTFCPSG